MTQLTPGLYQYELLAILSELSQSCSSRATPAEKTYPSGEECILALRGYIQARNDLLLQAARQFDVRLATEIRSLTFGPGVWLNTAEGYRIPISIRFVYQPPQHIEYDTAGSGK